ncbi:hypothetical protein SDC9_116973 [bioreactor metagenome]|uniref:Outer membrane protein beta-barrel domain-containing protein n=1 Tax=bioreactor metagenome TaxID=1076179 RepID=A0A645BXI2_9ZZZZ
MKKIFLTIATVAMLAFAAFAQEENNNEIRTLLGSKPHSNGGYIGLGGGYTQISGKDAFTTTFRGAWIIDHGFAIGVAGTGFSNDLYVGHESGSNYSSMQGGYGGLLLQPIIFPKFPVHVSFPVLLGVGGAASVTTFYNEPYDPYWDMHDEAFYFIAEPAAEVELNLVKWIRLSMGVSYRLTSPLNLSGYGDHDLQGLSGNVTLSFGKF